MTAIDTSPPVHREMCEFLDRSAFHKSISLVAARIHAGKTGEFLRSHIVKPFLLDLPKIRRVLDAPSNPKAERLVLLSCKDESFLPPEVIGFLRAEALGIERQTIELDYPYWTADQILNAILPEELCKGAPTAFTITGHIAHFNLREQYLPYKHLIGQVILDKNKSLKTVVNKLDNIDSEFRVFKMEVIAGEPDFLVEAHEAGCRFTFDFSKVYWNSRLHTEHERLVALFRPGDVIADAFAGVGPFAIPSAKKGCAVFANDLNPESTKYLERNAVDNHVNNRVRTTNLDARQFIRTVVLEAFHNPLLPSILPKGAKGTAQGERDQKLLRTVPSKVPSRRRIDHFVMNLPGTALEFLNAFRSILVPLHDLPDFESVYSPTSTPLVHCYCFTKQLDPALANADIYARAVEALGIDLPANGLEVHIVRSVAPNKDMYCLTFALPWEILV